jgi:hypothetical protein
MPGDPDGWAMVSKPFMIILVYVVLVYSMMGGVPVNHDPTGNPLLPLSRFSCV